MTNKEQIRRLRYHLAEARKGIADLERRRLDEDPAIVIGTLIGLAIQVAGAIGLYLGVTRGLPALLDQADMKSVARHQASISGVFSPKQMYDYLRCEEDKNKIAAWTKRMTQEYPPEAIERGLRNIREYYLPPEPEMRNRVDYTARMKAAADGTTDS